MHMHSPAEHHFPQISRARKPLFRFLAVSRLLRTAHLTEHVLVVCPSASRDIARYLLHVLRIRKHDDALWRRDCSHYVLSAQDDDRPTSFTAFSASRCASPGNRALTYLYVGSSTTNLKSQNQKRKQPEETHGDTGLRLLFHCAWGQSKTFLT